METDRFQLLSSIFERVSAAPRADRVAILDAECKGDADLRAEIEQLLHHAEQPDDPVVTAAGLDALFEEAGLRKRNGQPIPDVVGGHSHHTPSTFNPAAQSGAPMPVLTGQYRIIRVIGEGGMGIVYEAEQAFPKRRVALKSIRPGLFSRRMLRRFQNEAHILGRLQHPGIAHIYEAGASDPQHPDDAFFVMEFVDGPPLTTYADQKKLPTRQRLELMMQVCDAVHHAHQRGVIHRDLKPANILVAEEGGENGDPRPKILDFGVARVTDDATRVGNAADSMHTHAGQLIGTLAYMSPEQVSSTKDGEDGGGDGSGGGGVDVRTDVYALGVVLYQLLAGKLPLDLADKSIPDAAQIVREREPSKLGTIDRTYRGDLETIVAKALEKDRSRRYQSAAELGEDIGRYLRGEAIAAKRDSAMYVLRKQVRRHKGPVAAGVIAFVGLLAFAITAATQAKHNRTLADQLSTQLGVANSERARSVALATQLEDQLTIANSERARLLTVSGTPYLGERLMWMEHLQRPDIRETYWALWEYYSRQPIIRSTGGPGFQTTTAAVTPDGSTVIRSGAQGELEAWSAELDRCLWRTAPDGRRNNDVAVSPDGRFAVFVGAGGKFVIVDPASGRVIRRVDAGSGAFNCVAIAPDSRTVFIGDRTGDVMQWDAQTGKVVRRFTSRHAPIMSLTMSPSGELLVVGMQKVGVFAVFEVATAQMIGNIPLRGAIGRHAAFSPDGGLFLVLASDGTIREFDARSFEACGKIATGDPSTYTMTLLDDGTLVTAGEPAVRVWDIPTQALKATFPGSERAVGQLIKGPRPGTFYTYDMGNCLRLWETTPLNCSRPLPGGTRDWMLCIEPTPDGTRLIGSDARGAVRVWDASTGELLGSCQAPDVEARRIRVRPGAPEAFVACAGGKVGRVEISERAPRLLDSFQAYDPMPDDAPLNRRANHNVTALAVSRDGKRLATACERGPIRVFDADTHALVLEIPTTQQRVYDVNFSPDGRTLVAAGIGREAALAMAPASVGDPGPGIALFDASTGALLAGIADPYQNWKAVFSPDGSIIACARSRAEVEILDARTLKLIRTLRGHGTAVLSLAFDQTGQTIASGGKDGTFRLWNVATGGTLVSMDFGVQVSGLCFVPSSHRVATCGEQGQARVWNMDYYDRHIAGSINYYYNKIGPTLTNPPKTDLLLKWARETMHDPTLTFDDPSAAVPVNPSGLDKPLPPADDQ